MDKDLHCVKINDNLKPYNKNGYRLLAKVTGQAVPQGFLKTYPDAISMDTVCIEKEDGTRKIITSLKDKDEKLIFRQRYTLGENKFVNRIYKWFDKAEKEDDIYQSKKENPNVFTNYGVKIKTVVNHQGSDYKPTKYTVLDIKEGTKNFTKTNFVRYKTKKNDEEFFVNKSLIEEFKNGKRTKKLSQITTNKDNEDYKIVKQTAMNIPKELAKAVFRNNKYFCFLFSDKEDYPYLILPRAVKNQKTSMPLNFEIVENNGENIRKNTGQYIIPSDKINLLINTQKTPKYLISALLEHEARHKWQAQLCVDAENGLLTNEEEIKLAHDFKDNFENYTNKDEDYEAYKSQPVEDDAYRISKEVEDEYTTGISLLAYCFDNASFETLGL